MDARRDHHYDDLPEPDWIQVEDFVL